MINNAKKALITLEIFNRYSDILSERVENSGNQNSGRFYTGDIVNDTFQMFINNGWSPSSESPEEVFEVLKNVLCICFQSNGIDGMAEWSDDMSYITITE